MSAVGIIRGLIVAGSVSAAPLLAPSDLMLDRVVGFELTSDPATDLSYDEYLALEPDSIGHLDPDSEAAAELVGAVEVWTSDDGDEILVVELVRSIDESAAESLVDQAAAGAIAQGLATTDPPFVGAWSYSGEVDEVWTSTAAWNQGPYSVVLTQLSIDEVTGDTIGAAAVRQAEIILEATGIGVSEDAAVTEDAPVPPTEATVPATADESASGGGIPIGTVLLWLVIIGGAIFLFVGLRRKLAGARRDEPRRADDIIADARRRGRDDPAARESDDRPEERSTDDIIADARRRGRDERASAREPAESTEDVIARARREAREDVDRIDDGRKMPDDV